MPPEKTTPVPCPCCASSDDEFWAAEAGWRVVRCRECGMLFVNPQPDTAYIDQAVRSGQHPSSQGPVDVRARRIAAKIPRYRKLIRHLFRRELAADTPLVWIDVGCGYGEMLEAVRSVLPAGSRVAGVEPMQHKAASAAARGLEVFNGYLQAGQFQADVISNMDVFSHIADYRAFLGVVATNLKPGGALMVETGNTADIGPRSKAPNELGLPDHLTFAGEAQLRRYLASIGYEPKEIVRERFDTATQMAKNAAKLLLGRASNLSIPYTSPYRQLVIRAGPIE